MTRLNRILAPLTLAASLSLIVVVGAQGQAAKPVPGCASVYKDAKGDADPANLDITNFWFNYADGKLTAYMQINNLTTELPSDATGINWYVLWTSDGAQNFVQAQVEVPSSAPTFSYGTVDGNIRSAAGETPGQFFEGPDGIISVDVPPDVGGTAGKPLTAVIADTQKSLGIPGVLSALSEVDNASGRSYTVAACAGGGAATPTPGATPTPTPKPGGGPGGDQTVVAAGKLDVKLSGKLPAAKKVKKSLKVGLASSKGISGVNAALYKGDPKANKVVAKGKASKIAKKGKLTLKVSKKIKKGAYTLYLVGKNTDGQLADKKLKAKFK